MIRRFYMEDNFSDKIKKNKETFVQWMRNQKNALVKLKSLFHMSDEEFIERFFYFAEQYANLADDLEKIPSFDEFYDYLITEGTFEEDIKSDIINLIVESYSKYNNK